MKYFLFVITMFIAVKVSAQNTKPDKMIKKDNSQLEVKVTEITDDQVKYRKFLNLEGPVYSINKSEIAVIIYANGESELFSSEEKNSAPVEKPIQEAAIVSTPEKSEVSKPVTAQKNKEKGLMIYYEGGYCRFTDATNNIGGVYLGIAGGYKFNRAFSAEALIGYGTFFPDTPDGVIGITKLYSAYIMPKLTYRIYTSKVKDHALFFSAGAGYAQTSGEFEDFTQKGSPTYKLDGYGGLGYEIGGGFKFGIFGLSADYMLSENYSMIKIGIKIGM